MHAMQSAPDQWARARVTLNDCAESDKADMDVESFSDGYLGGVVIDEGGIAAVGASRYSHHTRRPSISFIRSY